MKRHRVVVHGPRPRWVRWLWLLGILLLVTAGYLGFRVVTGTWAYWPLPASDSEIAQLREERKQLLRDLRATRNELADLRGESTFSARACEIDAQACEALRTTVGEMEGQIADLREQLAMYRNILSPDRGITGIRVLQLKLRPEGDAQLWRYDLILVQPLQRNRVATGSYDMAVEGLLDGNLKTYGLSQLTAGKAESTAFSFRAFQEAGGRLKLPAGFLPSRVTVTLSLDKADPKNGVVKEAFDWSQLVENGEE